MDNQTPSPPAAPVSTGTPTTSTPPSPKPAKSGMSVIVKILIALVIAAVLISAGLYLGININRGTNQKPVSDSNQPVAVPSQTVMQETPTASPTAIQSTKTVIAGGGTGTSFGVYVVDVPAGWTDTLEKSSVVNKLTLTNGNYSLIITQGAFGGGGCTYPGDAQQQLAQKFTDFADITGSSNLFRRSWNKTGNPAGIIAYTVCQKAADGSFGSITTFGRVDAKSPDPADPTLIKNIDFMISSIAGK